MLGLLHYYTLLRLSECASHVGVQCTTCQVMLDIDTLLHYYISTLLHYYSATLLHCYIATLLHCYSATLLQCARRVMLEIDTLLNHYIATLLHCYSMLSGSCWGRRRLNRRLPALCSYQAQILSHRKSCQFESRTVLFGLAGYCRGWCMA